MNDQQSQPTSGETGTLEAGPAAPDKPAASEPVAVVAEVKPVKLAPEQEETSPKPDAPKVEAVGTEAPKVDGPKVDAPKIDAPKVDALKVDTAKIDAVKPEAPSFPRNVAIMSPGDRVGTEAKAAPAEVSSGKRRIGAMAAVVALATVAGALGGALATTGIGKLVAGDSAVASAKDSALEASVARLDAEIGALKASLEHTSKTTAGQLNKASDRLDKVEKAQAEPAAKLAKLSETVDKLRAAQASATTAAAAPAPAKEVTGSVPQQVAAVAPAAPPKSEVARLPTVEGWVLRDVGNGSALIEGRRGMYEVYAGDPVPGLGRVDAIRKQDGRWVVVTSKGLIVAR
ncbi:hypothetical protein [Bradyrhizobium retamae]|uniref:Uncharacterized protein n=1 Tax=Bradyrhizobium retamae TaxID=1300035 RepID=A0A0R3MDL9_9BRAD|nr:hypothetical protein [Bradyrhizobium retamae]KRR18011.1 hypothetical protein CQ13_11720 [Bradyrhizobium retamae]